MREREGGVAHHASCQVSSVMTQTSKPLSQARLSKLSSSSSSCGQYNWLVRIQGPQVREGSYLEPAKSILAIRSSHILDRARTGRGEHVWQTKFAGDFRRIQLPFLLRQSACSLDHL